MLRRFSLTVAARFLWELSVANIPYSINLKRDNEVSGGGWLVLTDELGRPMSAAANATMLCNGSKTISFDQRD